MSFEAMAWAVKWDLPVKQKITLLMLANRVNSDTGRCFPSISNLAQDCGMSETSVKEAIRSLKEAGILLTHERRIEGVSLTNEYEFDFTKFPPPRRNTPHPPAQYAPPPRRNTPPNLEEEPISEPDKGSQEGFFDQVEDAEKPKDDRFGEFWASYPACPRKTGKPQAHQAWARIMAGKAKDIPKTDPEVIIAAVKRFAASGADPQFIPLPTTWLNGARWDQFPPTVPSQGPRPQVLRPAWGEVTR